MECHLMSGGYDYLVRFVARGLTHYQEIIDGLLERNGASPSTSATL